jgi:hypothetical protein
MKKKWFLLIQIIVLSIATFSNIKAQSSASDKESARVFVQKFYDWYGAFAASHSPHQPDLFPLIMKQKSQCFNHELRTLITDMISFNAQAGQTVGLGFDPLTNDLFDPVTNDPVTITGYQTGKVRQHGQKFFVDVHNIKSGSARSAVLASKLILVAEVVKSNKKWAFFNFIYPKANYPKSDGSINLLETLKNM